MILSPSPSPHCPEAWTLTCQGTRNPLLPTLPQRLRDVFRLAQGWAGLDRVKQVPPRGREAESASGPQGSLLFTGLLGNQRFIEWN